MKRLVVKQVGVSEVEYIREFVVVIPDDCPEGLIECVRHDALEVEQEPNWVAREEFHITPTGPCSVLQSRFRNLSRRTLVDGQVRALWSTK